MRILAIETSCDDTGVAVLEIRNSKFEIRSNVVSSQVEVHKKYGGVFPMMAKREHQKNLVPVLISALRQAKLLKVKKYSAALNSLAIKKILEREENLCRSTKEFLENYQKPGIDLIAVTQGPGLEPCLWVGVNFAKALACSWKVPIVPVNHIEAHILVSYFENRKVTFPAIALVVSGGHTQLVLMKDIGKYKIIGETRDDAAGECFDKCAKILGLEYPGGPIISKIASGFKQGNIKLPRPMIGTKDYDFSFSGLKTAVLYIVRNRRQATRDKRFVGEMCFAVQQAIIEVLVKKTINAAKDYKAKTIILGGGVSANKELRDQLRKKIEEEIHGTVYLAPDPSYSTDNALMIAIAGFFNKNKKTDWRKIEAKANLRIA